jgi:vacuolar protein sorting-associated protein 52
VVLRDLLKLDGDNSLGDPEKLHEDADHDDEDSDFDLDGLSLEEYATRAVSTKPRSTSNLSAAEDGRQRYEDLHKYIADSDQVLENVEGYLSNFKLELGQVSAEIESLQDRSTQLNARLESRRKVEKLLGPAVEDVSVSPATVRAISEGPVDEAFSRALLEVETRSTALDRRKGESEGVKALEDVLPLLNDLKSRAVERIRDHVVSQIKSIRAPNVNAQLIQHQSFLRHKDLFLFLSRNHHVLFEEIGQAYINTLKWYYSSNFSRYQQALEKLPLHNIDQADLIGTEPTAPRRSVLGGNKAPPAQHDAFSISRRADILRSKADTVIPSYLAEDSKTSHYLEVPFRHFNQALIDNVSFEYTVDSNSIFAAPATSYQALSRSVTSIFESTFTIGHALTKHLIDTTTDCIGILICVRLNQHFAFELQRRKCPIAESYINYTSILLWPRFQQIMDLHADSLRKHPAASGATRGAASAAFSLVGGGDAASKAASVAPHAITQRFGQFMHAILSLSKDAGDDEPVAHSLGRLRTEYQALMVKLSKGAGDASKRPRFLFNNYSLVSTIISDAQGRLAEEQKEFFAGLLADTKSK